MILVGNGKLVTRDKEHPFYENGAVAIDGSNIVEVGTFDALKQKYTDATLIDAKGKVIMPGYINTHQHIYSAFARGLSIPGNHPMNFLEILEGTWWHIDRNLLLNHTYYSAMATYLECIQNGVTTVIDHHASYGKVSGSLYVLAEAAKKLGERTCLCYEISDRDGIEKKKEAITESVSFGYATAQKNSDMVRAMMGLHASFTVSDATLEEVVTANQGKMGYHVHVAEGQYDADHCKKHYGKSIVTRLRDWNVLGPQTICAHCIHIEPKDVEILKSTNTCVVHNPESNMGNAVGAPDVIGLLDAGILVGLGTDGYTSDMLESLKVANILQKHRRQLPDRGFVEAAQLLFENNKTIASRIFQTSIGTLSAGNKADLIIVDYHPYTPMNAENIDGHIMFGISGAMTDTTIIDGKVKMLERKLVEVDEQEIKAKCIEASKDLWKRL